VLAVFAHRSVSVVLHLTPEAPLFPIVNRRLIAAAAPALLLTMTRASTPICTITQDLTVSSQRTPVVYFPSSPVLRSTRFILTCHFSSPQQFYNCSHARESRVMCDMEGSRQYSGRCTPWQIDTALAYNWPNGSRRKPTTIVCHLKNCGLQGAGARANPSPATIVRFEVAEHERYA